MKFIQHIPAPVVLELAVRGVKPVEFDFNSLAGFLNHEFIRRITCDSNFEKFTICKHGRYELISELKDGRTFKIGEFDGDISEIGEWKKKE